MTAPVRLAVWLCACAWLVPAGRARAQEHESGPSRFEIAAGVAVQGGTTLGGAQATLTPSLGAPPVVLFSTSTEKTSAAGIDGRVGIRLASSLVVSGVASLAWGDVRTTIDGDTELPGERPVAAERLLLARFEGRVDWLLTRLRFANGRLVPFATASAGVLQEWHEGYTIKEGGQSFQAGGGLRFLFRRRPSSVLSQAGLTAEVLVRHLRGGYHLGADSRTMPAFGVGVLTGWGKRQ